MTPSELLQDPDVFATPAIAVLFDRYGGEALNWDPLTLNLRLKEDFRITPTQTLKDRVMAGSSVMTGDLFYTSLPVFSTVCGVLSRDGYSTEVLIPPETDHMAWACLEARLLDSAYDPSRFGGNIAGYAGYMLSREGMYTPPAILSFAAYPEDPGLGDLEKDPEWMEIYAVEQHRRKREFETSLRKAALELFAQLRSLEGTGIDMEFVDGAMERLGSGYQI